MVLPPTSQPPRQTNVTARGPRSSTFCSKTQARRRELGGRSPVPGEVTGLRRRGASANLTGPPDPSSCPSFSWHRHCGPGDNSQTPLPMARSVLQKFTSTPGTGRNVAPPGSSAVWPSSWAQTPARQGVPTGERREETSGQTHSVRPKRLSDGTVTREPTKYAELEPDFRKNIVGFRQKQNRGRTTKVASGSARIARSP